MPELLNAPAPIVARDAFLLDPDVAFLNHGSFGATPRVVLAAQSAIRDRLEREPVRFLADELPGELRRVADLFGARLGARGRDLAWVDNASTGVQAVLWSHPLGPGDEIVVCDHVYGAVRNAARHVAARFGARVVEAPVPFPISGPDAVVEAFDRAIGPRTRLVIADHVTSWSGLVLPIAAIVERCRARGVPVLVDGAHAPGMVPLDLERLGADWYVGNCHKWLFAPKGCAFLWARADRQADLHPAVISHGLGKGFVEEFDWTGTRDPSPWLSLEACFAFVDGLGPERVRAHNDALQRAAAEFLAASWGVEVPSPEGLRASLCTLPVRPGPADPATAVRLHAALQARGVQVPTWANDRGLWLRISAQVHNRPADYERLAAALPAALAEL